MIQINLLPWREQLRKQRQIEFGLVVGVFVLISALLVVFIHIVNSNSINKQVERNKMLEIALNDENNNLTELNKRYKNFEAIDKQLQFLFSLRDTSYRAVRVLTDLVKANPDTITLTKIQRKGNDVVVFGEAKSNLQVTLFMDSIEASKYFKQPDLTNISGEAGKQQSFELRVQLRE